MKKDYSHLLIKGYRYWDLNLFANQGYLGRCVVWCRREDALELTDITPAEQEELLHILRELRGAAQECFQPDWFNYAFLGNGVRHLHAHFVPRYAEKREFMDTVFRDPLYGQNFRTDPDFVTPPLLFQAVRSRLQQTLEKNALLQEPA